MAQPCYTKILQDWLQITHADILNLLQSTQIQKTGRQDTPEHQAVYKELAAEEDSSPAPH